MNWREKIFYYFWVTLFIVLKLYTYNIWYKCSIIETNNETQLKIHFQPFPSIAHNISEFFCRILCIQYMLLYTRMIYVNFIILKSNINIKTESSPFHLYIVAYWNSSCRKVCFSFPTLRICWRKNKFYSQPKRRCEIFYPRLITGN